ncbi:ImmA/IrrE family metallo-endopeptidase [Candidatus Uhrbacteria bacterium]|nr:ImmA/IrrE family metallo-endopeptidase [Candidatus Uhrbacteria bacterium]
MTNFSDVIQNARERARTLLAQYPQIIKNGKVDVEGLANELGIETKEASFEDRSLAGYIRIKQGQNLIMVNRNNVPKRQRFTIAHEIGHFILHPSQSVHVDDHDTAELVHYRNGTSSQATHLREIEANQFASELLMPESMILRDVNMLRTQGKGISEIIEELSEQYEVSQSAMTLRLNKVK